MKQSKSWGKCEWCKKAVSKNDGACLSGSRVWHSGKCEYNWHEQEKAKKIKTSGFLGISLKELRAVKHIELRSVLLYLIENAGQPCDSFDPDCIACRLWASWLTLYYFYNQK